MSLQQYESVTSWVATSRESGEAGTSRYRKPRSERRNPGNDGSIVPGVGDEQNHPSDPHVALLCVDPSFHGLHVIDPSLGFDQRFNTVAVDDPVRAPSIALDWHRHLSPPSKVR